jgi:hypothetical protein
MFYPSIGFKPDNAQMLAIAQDGTMAEAALEMSDNSY